jgi:hypothetical protein
MTTARSQNGNVTELREDIAQHRRELADTVDALAQKLDVKARLKAQVTARAVAWKPFAAPAAAALAGVTVLLVVVRRRRS